MNAPATRGAATAAFCKGCIYDPAAAGTWAEQVSACSAIDCPLWRFRPLTRNANAPAWIKSRDPADLPGGWATLHHDEAIRLLRGAVVDDKAAHVAVQARSGTRAPVAMEGQGLTPGVPKRAGFESAP